MGACQSVGGAATSGKGFKGDQITSAIIAALLDADHTEINNRRMRRQQQRYGGGGQRFRYSNGEEEEDYGSRYSPTASMRPGAAASSSSSRVLPSTILKPKDYGREALTTCPYVSTERNVVTEIEVVEYAPDAFHLLRELGGTTDEAFIDEWNTFPKATRTVMNAKRGGEGGGERGRGGGGAPPPEAEGTGGLELGEGRSMALFLKSKSMAFMCKTISETEVVVLVSILRDYLEHIERNPDTMLMRFVMLLKVTVNTTAYEHDVGRGIKADGTVPLTERDFAGLKVTGRGSEVGYVLVFNDCFSNCDVLHERWDLKGRHPKPGKYRHFPTHQLYRNRVVQPKKMRAMEKQRAEEQRSVFDARGGEGEEMRGRGGGGGGSGRRTASRGGSGNGGRRRDHDASEYTDPDASLDDETYDNLQYNKRRGGDGGGHRNANRGNNKATNAHSNRSHNHFHEETRTSTNSGRGGAQRKARADDYSRFDDLDDERAQQADLTSDDEGSDGGAERNLRADKTLATMRLNTRKDKDLARLFWLEPADRQYLIQQITADFKFLLDCGLMDYSILIGVRYNTPEEQYEKEQRKTTNNTTSNGLRSIGGPTPPTSPNDGQGRFPRQTQSRGSLHAMKMPFVMGEEKAAGVIEVRPASSTAFGSGGGVGSGNAGGGVSEPDGFHSQFHQGVDSIECVETYYIGIIDMLTVFNIKKKIANTCKKCLWREDTLSTIPPHKYAERIEKYAHRIFPRVAIAECNDGTLLPQKQCLLIGRGKVSTHAAGFKVAKEFMQDEKTHNEFLVAPKFTGSNNE